MNDGEDTTLTVLTADTARTRSFGKILYRRESVQIQDLTGNISNFLDQMTLILNTTPDSVGKFRLEEISISAEITTEGKVVLCGVGGEIGISGGLEFVFKRA
jgi:hypothetical protein